MARWFIAKRMMFIGTRLLREGLIRRADLIAEFGVSPQQASTDFARFLELCPSAMVYDASAKAYVLAALHRGHAPMIFDAELAAKARPCRELANICDHGGECLRCDAIQGDACKRPHGIHTASRPA